MEPVDRSARDSDHANAFEAFLESRQHSPSLSCLFCRLAPLTLTLSPLLPVSSSLSVSVLFVSFSPSFSQFVLCLTSNNSIYQNIGGRMHGPSPTSKFGGPFPQSPLSLRPCTHTYIFKDYNYTRHMDIGYTQMYTYTVYHDGARGLVEQRYHSCVKNRRSARTWDRFPIHSQHFIRHAIA